MLMYYICHTNYVFGRHRATDSKRQKYCQHYNWCQCHSFIFVGPTSQLLIHEGMSITPEHPHLAIIPFLSPLLHFTCQLPFAVKIKSSVDLLAVYAT